MSHHFRVSYSKDVDALLAKGYAVLPQHRDDLEYDIICVDTPCSQNGYTECHEDHICEHGCDARGGFEESDPDGKVCPGHQKTRSFPGTSFPDMEILNCWDGEEEFDFHGVTHTWRYGWGWTVPYAGCIVQSCAVELPDGFDRAPVGLYNLDIEWVDDSDAYLEVGDPIEKENTEP